VSFWLSFWDRYSWDRVRDRIRGLPGRLGFEKSSKLRFFGLVLDLETGAIYDGVLERYLTFKEAAGVYFILSLYSETRDDVGECGELVSLSQIVPEHCLDCPLVRKNIEVFKELFSKDPQLLYKAAEPLNYTRIDLGDAAIKVYALPRVPMVLALWSGEEGIPPSVQVLFDKNAVHYLSEDLASRLEAVMGLTRALTGRLVLRLTKITGVDISSMDFGGVGYIGKD
jgi:hypothetical protein